MIDIVDFFTMKLYTNIKLSFKHTDVLSIVKPKYTSVKLVNNKPFGFTRYYQLTGPKNPTTISYGLYVRPLNGDHGPKS